MANISKIDNSIKVAKNIQKSLIHSFLMFVWFIVKKAGKQLGVKDILKSYYTISGQIVDFHKSTVQFLKGTQIPKKHDIVNILQVPSSNMWTYLGC